MKGDVMGQELINMPNNEIVIYQPDDTTRLSVRFDGETVWLSQEQMIDLFQRDRSVISRHIANAFKEGEVDKENCLHILQTNAKGRAGRGEEEEWYSDVNGNTNKSEQGPTLLLRLN